jgi:hypothetical protein
MEPEEKAFARQRLGKHITAATHTHAKEVKGTHRRQGNIIRIFEMRKAGFWNNYILVINYMKALSFFLSTHTHTLTHTHIWAWIPKGTETKNYCAGIGRQQNAALLYRGSVENHEALGGVD